MAPLSGLAFRFCLELNSERERQLPWLSSGSVAGELVRSAAAVDESGRFDADRAAAATARVSGADDVEGIERVHAELRVDALVDREPLHQRHVGVEEGRSEVAIAAAAPELVKKGASEALVSAAVAQIVPSGNNRIEEGPLVGDRIETAKVRLEEATLAVGEADCVAAARGRVALVISETEWKTAAPGDDRAQLPSADDLVRPSRYVRRKHTFASKGKIVDTIHRDLLLTNVVVPALAILLVPGSVLAGEVDALLPGVGDVPGQSLGVLLGHGDLQGVEVAVLVVAVKSDIVVGVTASAVCRKSHPCRRRRRPVTGLLASWQDAAVVTGEQSARIGAAVYANTIRRARGASHDVRLRIPVQGSSDDTELRRQNDRRFIWACGVAVTGAEGMRTLVADIGESYGESGSDRALHAQIPSVDSG